MDEVKKRKRRYHTICSIDPDTFDRLEELKRSIPEKYPTKHKTVGYAVKTLYESEKKLLDLAKEREHLLKELLKEETNAA